MCIRDSCTVAHTAHCTLHTPLISAPLGGVVYMRPVYGCGCVSGRTSAVSLGQRMLGQRMLGHYCLAVAYEPLFFHHR